MKFPKPGSLDKTTSLIDAFMLLALAEVADRLLYNQDIKDGAQSLIDDGFDSIWLQCQANGDVKMADDVAKEVKLHYDLERKKGAQDDKSENRDGQHDCCNRVDCDCGNNDADDLDFTGHTAQSR